MKKKTVIMGAAGRDFHNFNMVFRDNPEYEVVAFTATQIPFISDRTYPARLAGGLYPEGIPIFPEERLPEIIEERKADTVVFSYSDVTHEHVMHKASLVIALGADFMLLGASRTMLGSSRPVISVCAVRTGSGKSGVTRYISRILKDAGKTPVAIRHPMPYGDLLRQEVQRFKDRSDIISAMCTIEEMEEFEPLVNEGVVVYSGVDYAKVLARAEEDGDVIIWDGGNNDLPFIKPGLELVVADPLRPGHELGYHPGEANLRRADVVIINKANAAHDANIRVVRDNIARVNPCAAIIATASTVSVDGPIEGKSVLVIEDGPTLTHGGMAYGAGLSAARKYGARPVDASPYAVGSIKEVLRQYKELKELLPAVGYSKAQVAELEETINKTPCDAVIIATPVDLSKLMKINKPVVRVHYGITEIETPGLKGRVLDFIKGA